MKKISLIVLMCVIILNGCGQTAGNQAKEESQSPKESTVSSQSASAQKQESTSDQKQEPTSTDIVGQVNLGAAASLTNVFEQRLIPLFNQQYPTIKVIGTFDSSGKIRAQIEQGLKLELFISASTKHANLLVEQGMTNPDLVQPYLENKIVFIKNIQVDPEQKKYNDFADIIQSDKIAIGNPDSVPVGEYSKLILDGLGLWEQVEAKASLGTNVTEVLTWVKEGSAEVGIVYQTDAVGQEQVVILKQADQSLLDKRVIYPLVLFEQQRTEPVEAFLTFLKTSEVKGIFEEYGFEGLPLE